jgi:cyanate permease
MLTLGFYLQFISAISWFAVPPMANLIMIELNLTHTQTGLIIAAPGLGALFFAYLSGLITDKVGYRLAMAFGTVIFCASGILRGIFPNFILLFFSSFFIGAGGVMFLTNLPKLVSLWFKREQIGTANGIWNLGFQIGGLTVLAGTMSVFFPLINNWQSVFLLYGFLGLFGIIFWMIFAKNPPYAINQTYVNHDNGRINRIYQIFKNRNVLLLSGIFFCLLMVQSGILGWLPVILEQKGISAASAGMITSASWAGAIPSIIILLISDKLSVRKPFMFFLLLFLGPVTYFTGTTLDFPLLTSVFFLGFCSSPLYPLILTVAYESKDMDISLIGGATGIMLTFAYFGSFIAPYIVGYLRDTTGSFFSSIIILTLIAEVAAILSLFLKESKKLNSIKDYRKKDF